MMARFHGHVNPSAMHALEVAFGVNTHESLLRAYFAYLGNSLQGKFGISLTDFPLPVSQVIMKALPWSLGLVGITTILGFILGTVIGAIAAWRRGGLLDSVLPPVFIVVSAFPYFWIGLLAVWLFALTLGWFPLLGGYNETAVPALTWGFVGDILDHSVLPAMTILITVDRRVDPHDAQQHDHRGGRGLREDGPRQGAQAAARSSGSTPGATPCCPTSPASRCRWAS